MTLLSRSEADTERLAAEIAKDLRPGTVLLLRGNLGSGKTVFARALIRTLSADPDLEVPSPTFTLAQTYDTPAGPLWHFDLYRLKDPEEVYEIGWEVALEEGIVIVEWPERLGTLIPRAHTNISITSGPDPGTRNIEITRHGH